MLFLHSFASYVLDLNKWVVMKMTTVKDSYMAYHMKTIFIFIMVGNRLDIYRALGFWQQHSCHFH
jgi:hypothetical protein